MHKKCDDCRFLGTTTKPTAPRRTIEFCTSPNTASAEIQNMFPDRHGVPIDMARQACDREDDGHFVYFEPKNNNPNGAAFVQLTRERPAPRARRHAAGGII